MTMEYPLLKALQGAERIIHDRPEIEQTTLKLTG
jgi:hypothetical protein